MRQLHRAAGRSLQQRLASDRRPATEYHLAGPRVLQLDQSGSDAWHQTFDVRDVLVGGIGRELKLQSSTPVVVDFESEVHVPASARVFTHGHHRLSASRYPSPNVTNFLGNVRPRARLVLHPGRGLSPIRRYWLIMTSGSSRTIRRGSD